MIIYYDTAIIEIYSPVDFIGDKSLQIIKKLVKYAKFSDEKHNTDCIQIIKNALPNIEPRTARDHKKLERLNQILKEV